MMALAIGILLIALSVRLGLVADAWQIVKQSFQRDTATVELIQPGDGIPSPPPGAFDEVETFVIVDTMPELIGGLEDLQARIHYPEIAKKAGIQGRVFLQFVVEKDGTPVEIMVTRGLGGGCDDEAVRALSETRFTPGMQRGIPVRVKMSIPVTYRLN